MLSAREELTQYVECLPISLDAKRTILGRCLTPKLAEALLEAFEAAEEIGAGSEKITAK